MEKEENPWFKLWMMDRHGIFVEDVTRVYPRLPSQSFPASTPSKQESLNSSDSCMDIVMGSIITNMIINS